MFKYRPGHRFCGDEIDVIINQLRPANPVKGWSPAYVCHIVPPGQTRKLGHITVRIGYTNDLVKYSGHIGYGVSVAHRGNGYAAKGCRLVKPIFQAHGMDVIWITCNPDNWPSRKTCERLGCTLVDIVDLPETNDMYQEGERQKCRYRWIIY